MIEAAGLKELRPGDLVNVRDPGGLWSRVGWIARLASSRDAWEITLATAEDRRPDMTWVVDLKKLLERERETFDRKNIMFVMRNHLHPRGSRVYHWEHGPGRVMGVDEARFMENDAYVVECHAGRFSAYPHDLEAMIPEEPVSFCKMSGVEVETIEEVNCKIPVLTQYPDEEIVV